MRRRRAAGAIITTWGGLACGCACASWVACKGGGGSLMQLPSLTPGPNGEHDELLLRQLLSFKKLKAFLLAVFLFISVQFELCNPSQQTLIQTADYH